MMVGEPGPTWLCSVMSPVEVTPMPVFFALALISGQPLNLVPDDCPNLPPYRICLQRYLAAFGLSLKLNKEVVFRKDYNPNLDWNEMRATWLKDPEKLRQWREQGIRELNENMLEPFDFRRFPKSVGPSEITPCC
jgi:hypothetical protein